MPLDSIIPFKQTDAINEYQRQISQDNRERVIQSILELQKATPKQIADYLNNSKNKQSISIRTVKRHLKDLLEKNIIQNKNGTYYPSTNLKSFPISYMPNIFGQFMLNSAAHFFLDSIEQSFNEFLIRIGSLILFTFIEASCLRNSIDHKDVDQEYFNSWLNKAIPLNSMWLLFVNLYQIRNLKKNSELLDIKNIPNKIDPNVLEKLKTIFRNQYPEIYQQLENSLADLRLNLDELKGKTLEETKRLGKYKAALKFEKNIKYKDNGESYIAIKASKPYNRIYGYVASKKFDEEIKELQKENNNL